MAKKIAHDALDEEIKDENKNEYLEKIMKFPNKLEELDLEDYAEHLETVKKKPNMIHLLRFIVDELSLPFKDPRPNPSKMKDEDLFYKLSKESSLSFKIYCFVTVKVRN